MDQHFMEMEDGAESGMDPNAPEGEPLNNDGLDPVGAGQPGFDPTTGETR
jgi:hypothetical protein